MGGARETQEQTDGEGEVKGRDDPDPDSDLDSDRHPDAGPLAGRLYSGAFSWSGDGASVLGPVEAWAARGARGALKIAESQYSDSSSPEARRRQRMRTLYAVPCTHPNHRPRPRSRPGCGGFPARSEQCKYTHIDRSRWNPLPEGFAVGGDCPQYAARFGRFFERPAAGVLRGGVKALAACGGPGGRGTRLLRSISSRSGIRRGGRRR